VTKEPKLPLNGNFAGKAEGRLRTPVFRRSLLSTLEFFFFLAPLNSAFMALAAIGGGMIFRKSTRCFIERPAP
jgi:hypothetical protein